MGRAHPSGFAWLEVLLVIAVIGLLLQLYPPAWDWVVGVIDVRRWSRSTGIIVNIVVLALLFFLGIRQKARSDE